VVQSQLDHDGTPFNAASSDTLPSLMALSVSIRLAADEAKALPDSLPGGNTHESQVYSKAPFSQVV
jgi:hypothetical protein